MSNKSILCKYVQSLHVLGNPKKKSENWYVGHPMSDEWGAYYFVKESGSANQPKEKDV